ncbi:MAG: hypothetical protein IM674_04280 [Brevundimonas sp.]|nr:hypothetical protein [Brevundimonas sp.]
MQNPSNQNPDDTLRATFLGSGIMTADLRVGRPIAAAFSGSGLLTADLRVEKTLAAAFTGSGTMSATLDPSVRLAAAFSARGTMAANLQLSRPDRKITVSADAPPVGGGNEGDIWIRVL